MTEALQSLQGRLLLLADRLDERAKKYESLKDSRAVFTHTYTIITRALAGSLVQPNFDDPEWIVSLAEAFAERYFVALDAFDNNGEVPAAWAEVFRVLKIRYTSVLEDLLFAMTAHIVNDLPLALIDVGFTPARIRDYHKVNDILGSNIQGIEDQVLNRYEPIFKWLDHLSRGQDLILSNFGFRLSRGMAWYNALRLMDPGSAAEVKAALERSAVELIDKVHNPPILSLRILFRVLRFIAAVFRRW